MARKLSKQTKRLLNILPLKEQDNIYRYIWHQHVMEDVRSHAETLDIELTDDEIDTAAEYYVYDGDYDCNLSYWDNIEACIHAVKTS